MRELKNNKIIAIVPDGIIVRAERMFPNCEKYKKCCTKDEKFWDNLQERVKEINPKKQPFRIKKVKLEFTKAPEGFADGENKFADGFEEY